MTNLVLENALRWLEFGVTPMPFYEKSKKPVFRWKGWQYKLPSAYLVEKWFKRNTLNLGLVCGGERHLVVLDFDKLPYYYDWKAQMVKRNDVWKNVATNGYRIRTSRGMHVYITTEEETPSMKYPKIGLDIKAIGGCVLTAPSIHPTGKVYTDCGGEIISVHSIFSVFPKPEFVPPPHTRSLSPIEMARDDGGNHNDLIKRIKENISVLTLASEYTEMFPTSGDGRWYMGRCPHPMHDDKNPSFRIDNHNGKAQCLTPYCELHEPRSLDVIDLFARINSISTKDSIYILSERLGFLE